MKKNNKGFSLIELIVVIAIMALLMITVVSYVGMLGRSETRNCAKELMNHMSQTKVCAMSKSNAKLIVWKNDDGVFVKSVQGQRIDTEQIGKANVKVSYLTKRDGSTVATVGTTESSGFVLEYDRASGALKKGADGKYHFYGFIVESGNDKYVIEFEPITGKASLR